MMLIKIRFFLALKCILLAQNILCYEVRDDAASTPKAQLVKLDPPGKQSQLKIKKKRRISYMFHPSDTNTLVEW
jgi:hypothetical protein